MSNEKPSREVGWDYRETQKLFDDFFEDKDPNQMTQAQIDEFMRQFEAAILMLMKGINEGKVTQQ